MASSAPPDLLAVVAELAGVVDALLWSGPLGAPMDFSDLRWREYTGLALDRGWEVALHPDDVAAAREALHEAVALGVGRQLDARLRGRDGSFRWYRVRFAVADGRWFAFAADTDAARRRLEEERALRADIEQANRLKDRFLAAISHELRAPVTTLLLWERLLREESLDSEARTRALDAIHHSAVLQGRLVADLLDVSRAISGKLRVESQLVELDPVLGHALEAARPAAIAKQVRLEHELAAGLRTLGDASRLEQIVVNLVENAIKFTPTGGLVRLRAWRAAESVVLEVSDTGRGIAPEFLPHVFDPFSQADGGELPSAAGLGLGLAIAHELVVLHGGTIEAASAGVGCGSTFTLRLRAATGVAPVEAVHQGTLHDISLLLVDDDPRVATALQYLLQRAGARVACASSVAEAWAQLLREVPDVVLSDLAMPGEDGYELVRRIREVPGRLGTVPAIALTAHTTTADRERALVAGFDRHVPKPIDVDGLVDTIADLLHPRP